MRASRVDVNQAEIVAALRKCGCSVQCLHAVGKGVPDLLVGRAGHNYLVEVKTPKGKLNGLQEKWHSLWSGNVSVCRTLEDIPPMLLAWDKYNEGK